MGLGGVKGEYGSSKVRREPWLMAFYSCPTLIVADMTHTMKVIDESFNEYGSF
jgi:hypothetical protein